MEKYTIFMDQKNQYSENEYTSQSNPLLVLEQESTIPAQWIRTSTSPCYIRNQTSTEGGELQASE